MTFRRYFILNLIWLFFVSFQIYGQATPQEFGERIFNAFHNDSTDNLLKLVPTLKEMETIAEQFGFTKDSRQYIDLHNGFQDEIDKFKEKVSEIFGDTLDNELDWKKTALEKVTKYDDTIHLDNRDPDSKTAPVATIKIYFTCNKNRFVLTLNDTFKIGDLWKIGNDIYMKQLKSNL